MLAENIIQQTYMESLEDGTSVADVLKVINERFIAAKSDIENYLTGLLVRTKENDDGTCTVTLANAGHPYPLMYFSDRNEVEEILPDVESPYTGPVGLSGFNVEYSEMDFTMKKGDVLLMYTDGLTETVNKEGMSFDIPRVIEVLKNKKEAGAQEIMQYLMDSISKFSTDTPRTDDVSVIILKRI